MRINFKNSKPCNFAGLFLWGFEKVAYKKRSTA
jgi:hypothetical protein